jgi:ABC-2 type transport system permease protein
MVGIIALALSALSVARDFELGTIRVLLVNQPNRLRFLLGKLAALAAMIVAAVTAAAIVAGALGLALSGYVDIDTSSWSAAATLSTYANLTIGALIWGVFGAAIAVVARSASTAITAGVAYFLVGENLLGLVWDNVGDWLPAGLLDTFMSGGSSDVTYLTAAGLLTIYAAAATTALSTVFARRDITD